MEMVAEKRTRGKPITVPLWWFKQMTESVAGYSTTELATVLTSAVSRVPAWDRTTVGKFLKNEHTTIEMVDAMCRAFEMTPPFFVAADHAEALALLDVKRKHEKARRERESNPEKAARLAKLDNLRERMEKGVSDQTQALESLDEGSKVRRSPRGVGRRRTPTS